MTRGCVSKSPCPGSLTFLALRASAYGREEGQAMWTGDGRYTQGGNKRVRVTVTECANATISSGRLRACERVRRTCTGRSASHNVAASQCYPSECVLDFHDAYHGCHYDLHLIIMCYDRWTSWLGHIPLTFWQILAIVFSRFNAVRAGHIGLCGMDDLSSKGW